MSALSIDKKIARRQRGIRLRPNDAFFRAGRLLVINSASGPTVEYQFADGRSVSQTKQEFLSRDLTRVSVKKGESPTNLSMAISISRSKNFSKREKMSLLRGLVKSSSGQEKIDISAILSDVRSSPSVSSI
tara:strand:+ start:686 stop:1078 length:393 start_codon:yes stop_codon:yes gene_type:complete